MADESLGDLWRHGQFMADVVNELKSPPGEKFAPDAACFPELAASSLVYVVDDEPMVGEVVETILQMDGFNTQYFFNPETAMKAFEQANPRPQVLVTDFVMGAINGMELIDQCVRLDPLLKTVLYSGNVGEQIMRNYLVQPDRFVSKPFQPKHLSLVVRDLLTA